MKENGFWIEYDDDPLLRGECSICGWQPHLYEDDVLGMPYCPNCGHKMEKIIYEEDYKKIKNIKIFQKGI